MGMKYYRLGLFPFMKRHIVLIQIFLVDCGIVIICLRLSFQFVGILAGELRQLGN